MTRNSIITLGKTTILCAAVFFSAAAFADTCPKAEEMHSDQQSPISLITDSGWISRFPVTNQVLKDIKELEFSDVTFNPYKRDSYDKPNQVTGTEIACNYRVGGEEVTMGKEEDDLVVITKQSDDSEYGNWHLDDDQFVCDKGINDCKFEIIDHSENNDNVSASPFGK